MSKSRAKRLKEKQQRRAERNKLPRLVRWSAAIIDMPRLVRLLLCVLVALMVALTVTLVWVRLSEAAIFLTLPIIVAVVVGFVVYLLGWWLIVGYIGEPPPVRVGVLVYLVLGLVALVTALGLVMTGYFGITPV